MVVIKVFPPINHMGERILFVSPAKLYPAYEDGRPKQYVRQNVSLPALTILGSLKSHGYEVDFMDLSADGYDIRQHVNRHLYRFGLPDEAVVERIDRTKPNALMINSMFTAEQMTVDSMAEAVKKYFPDLPIIVGGAHATIRPEWILEAGNADYVVAGEGEEIAPALMSAIMEGKAGERIIRQEIPLTNLGERPWAFDEVLMRDGEYRYDEKRSRRSKLHGHMTGPGWNRSFSLFYSRGCPFDCGYCLASRKDGREVRHMGHERAFGDTKMLHEKFGVQVFYNQADYFGGGEDISYLRKMAEYRKDNHDFAINNPNAFSLNLFFPKSDGYELDEGLLDLLSASGFNVITVAVETFNKNFNDKISFGRNKISPEKIGELFSEIHRRKMKTELYMIYAFPGQNKDELYDDEKKAECIQDIDEVAWQNCMVLPGTGYYQKLLERGRIDEKRYREKLKDGYFFHSMPEEFNFSDIPAEELGAFRERHPPVF